MNNDVYSLTNLLTPTYYFCLSLLPTLIVIVLLVGNLIGFSLSSWIVSGCNKPVNITKFFVSYVLAPYSIQPYIIEIELFPLQFNPPLCIPSGNIETSRFMCLVESLVSSSISLYWSQYALDSTHEGKKSICIST